MIFWPSASYSCCACLSWYARIALRTFSQLLAVGMGCQFLCMPPNHCKTQMRCTGRDPRLNPHTYYEQVAPSDWQPAKEGCMELHRRAYCGYGDILFPPLYFTVVGSMCFWSLLPFWGILLVLLPLFGAGVHFIVFKGATFQGLACKCANHASRWRCESVLLGAGKHCIIILTTYLTDDELSADMVHFPDTHADLHVPYPPMLFFQNTSSLPGAHLL